VEKTNESRVVAVSDLHRSGTAGADTKGCAHVLFRAAMIVIGFIYHHYSRFPLIQTSFTVAARVNRHKQDVQGK